MATRSENTSLLYNMHISQLPALVNLDLNDESRYKRAGLLDQLGLRDAEFNTRLTTRLFGCSPKRCVTIRDVIMILQHITHRRCHQHHQVSYQ